VNTASVTNAGLPRSWYKCCSGKFRVFGENVKSFVLLKKMNCRVALD
jgi:hypothetical protein